MQVTINIIVTVHDVEHPDYGLPTVYRKKALGSRTINKYTSLAW